MGDGDIRGLDGLSFPEVGTLIELDFVQRAVVCLGPVAAARIGLVFFQNALL